MRNNGEAISKLTTECRDRYKAKIAPWEKELNACKGSVDFLNEKFKELFPK